MRSGFNIGTISRHPIRDLSGDRHYVQTCLARLAACIDDSARRVKPRARRFAEAGAGKGVSPLALRHLSHPVA